MPLSRSSFAKAIVLTAAITSAFWLVLFAWWTKGNEGVLDRVDAGNGANEAAVPQAERPQSLEREQSVLSARPSNQSKPAQPSELVIPVAGVSADDLFDTFTDARSAGTRRHEAIDIMAPVGTPVIAAGPGKVERLFLSDAGGKTVYIRSPDGRRIYYYAHLRSYAPTLVEGARIEAGEPIGTVGSSGNADGQAPHLHFAIMRTTPDKMWFEDAAAINPYPLLVPDQPTQ